MSRLFRIARMIFADLEQSIQILTQKYGPAIQAVEGTLELADAMETIRSIAGSVPEKYLEWTVQQVVGRKLRFPEDLPRVEPVMTWYQQAKGDQKFRELIEQEKPGANVKNPLEFSIHELEAAQRLLTPQKSRRQQLKEQKVSGATEVYNSGGTKILRIGGEGRDLDVASQAACQYAKGTKWCVSDPQTARGYLEEAPLYVIFDDVSPSYDFDAPPIWEKVALFHPDENQLMDVEDRPIDYDSGWWEMLKAAGAIDDPSDWLGATGDDSPEELKQMALASPQGALGWAENVIEEESPELLGHWPEGEAVIAQSGSHSISYAELINNRFPAGEPAMLESYNNSLLYASDYAGRHIRGRWPELEKKLLESGDGGLTLRYMSHAFANPFWPGSGKRWVEAEPVILQDPDAALRYALGHYHKRWLEGEKAFLGDDPSVRLLSGTNTHWLGRYVKMLGRNDPEGLKQFWIDYPHWKAHFWDGNSDDVRKDIQDHWEKREGGE